MNRERRVFMIDDSGWQLCAIMEEAEDGRVLHDVEVRRCVGTGGRRWMAERVRVSDSKLLDVLTLEFESAVTPERAVQRVSEEWPWCVTGTADIWEA